MPTVLRVKGYAFGFYASDQNERPHVHVKKSGKMAKYWLEPVVAIEESHGFRPHELNESSNCTATSYWRLGMSSSLLDLELNARAVGVVVTDQTIKVDLEDGRTIIVPTAWYPRLQHATPKERKNFEITPLGIEWSDVEADFSIRGLLLGRKSGESPESFGYWIENRRKGKKVTFRDYMKRHRQPTKSRESRRRAG